MHGSHAKNFTNEILHVWQFFLLLFAMHLCHHSLLYSPIKKAEWNLYCIFDIIYKIQNHFKLIIYLKGRLNLKEHLSVMLNNIKETIHQHIQATIQTSLLKFQIDFQ